MTLMLTLKYGAGFAQRTIWGESPGEQEQRPGRVRATLTDRQNDACEGLPEVLRSRTCGREMSGFVGRKSFSEIVTWEPQAEK